jgi:SepF-like predicted cell division protein (DUF552 family)
VSWLRKLIKDKSSKDEHGSQNMDTKESGTQGKAPLFTPSQQPMSARQPTPRQDIYIKSISLLSLDQVPAVGEEVRDGNIVILDTEPMSLSKKQRIDLRRAIDQLRGLCREYGGDLAQLGESYYIVLTPGFIKIWEREEETGQSDQDPTPPPSPPQIE